MAKGTLPGIQIGQITNFSGGANFRDAPTELAATESYDAYNVTFDERGGVQSRLGYAKRNITPYASGSYASQVLAATPKLYWRLGESPGATTAQDASGNGNTGTYESGTVLGTTGPLAGDPNTAATFNDVPSSGVQSTSYYPTQTVGSTRTFMGWGYRLSGSADDDVLLLAKNGSFSPFSFFKVPVGTSDVVFGAGANIVTWAAAWPGYNQWVHWTLTYNDTTKVAELFISGVSKGQLTLGSPLFSGTANMFAVGSSWPFNSAVWNGSIDEIAVFESILSGATILAIYNAGVTANASSPVINDYYSPLLGGFLTQAGKDLYFSGSSRHTFSTTGCLTFAELGGKVIVGHPVDGLWYSTDGVSWTHITSANAPATANCICTWMSKLFVGMSDGTVHWSAASDPTTWAANDFNAIWTKDQKPIVALAVGSGQDIQGRPGLLAFKQESVYRINDSGTGAYTVVDTSHGAAGPKAVVGVGARVCWIGKGGIWWWREDQASPVNASDLLRPLWRNEQLSFSNQSGWAAGRRLNRAYFSCSSLTSNINDIAIELHPDEEWVALRSDAMTCYSIDASELTYGGSTTALGQMYQLDIGGLDDGNPISGWFQTRWIIPNAGFQAQVWQIRLNGRGSGTLEFRKDYKSTGSDYSFNFLSGGFKYDNGVLYDAGNVYVDVATAASESFAGLGTCREFSLRLSFTTTSTASGRQIGTSPVTQLGAFGLYGAEILFVPLGLS